MATAAAKSFCLLGLLVIASAPLAKAHPALYSPCLVNVSQFSAGELIISGTVAEAITTLEECDNSCIEEETCKYFTWDQITTGCQWYNGDFASVSGTEKLCTVSGIAKCTSAMDQTDRAGLIDQCQACPAGWALKAFGESSHCYYHEQTPKTATAAEANCVSKGGHLASIHSQEEQDFLHQLKGSPTIAFIGLDDSAVEGTFKWTDGTKVDFTEWESGQPNGGPPAGHGVDTGEDYVALWSSNGKWRDLYSQDMDSICKKQVWKQPT